jgi:hypothetical protein
MNGLLWNVTAGRILERSSSIDGIAMLIAREIILKGLFVQLPNMNPRLTHL